MNRALTLLIFALILSARLEARNLLTNPGFDRDLSGWTIEFYPGLDVRWDSRDALGDRQSGSILLSFNGAERTTSLGRVHQIVPVTPGVEYAFGAKIRQISNPAHATAFIAMFWLNPNGGELYQGETAVVSADGAWVSVSSRGVAPPEAASVEVRLYIREVRGTAIAFDDVFVERIAGSPCPVSCGHSVPEGAATGTPVAFGALLSPGCETPQVLWDFGDGATSGSPAALHPYSNPGVYRWTLSQVSQHHSCVTSGTITIASLPVISFFAASPPTLNPGEPVVLSWSTAGASSVSIDGVSDSLPASGTVTVRPTRTVRYFLRATNVAGTDSAEVLVQVTASRRRAVRR